MKIRTLSLLLLSVSITATAQQNINMNNNPKVDSLLKSVYKKDLPGASIAIADKGQIIFKKNYGLKDIGTKEKITSATNFNIASLTKQFTAMAILQLAAQKKLALSDKLSKFFPELNRKIADAVTIKELLTHSSGIHDHYNYTNTKNMHHAYDKDVMNAIKNVDSTYFPPGTEFRYSNTAFCLLALIVEKTSGLSFSEYLQNKFFLPLGMKHSIVWNEHVQIFQPATGYAFDSAKNKFIKSQAEENIFFSTEGDGGIYTSVDDYLKWFNALQNGKALNKTMIKDARSIEFSIHQDKNLGYGFGWFIDNSGPWKKVYHSGSNGGFRTYSFTIPSKEFLIVIFSNRDDIDLEEIVQKIIHLLMPGEKPFTKIEKLTS